MAYYRYLVANCDIPAENIRAGDLIEIPLGTHEPIGSYRKHGQNHGRFLGYEADGQLTPVDGVIGFPDRNLELDPSAEAAPSGHRGPLRLA